MKVGSGFLAVSKRKDPFVQTSHLPRITLVTPSFQHGQFIEKTIESVLAQNYPNLEYFIFDGGSTDNTVSVIRKYESRISFWQSTPDRGQSHAINRGLARATGQLFNWLNADDQLAEGALLQVGTAWNTHHPHVLSGPTVDVNLVTGAKAQWGPRSFGRLRHFLGVGVIMPLSQPSTFVDRETLLALGGVREDLRFRMDWDLYLRLCLSLRGNLRFHPLEKVLSHSLIHPDTKTARHGPVFEKEVRAILSGLHSLLPTERFRVQHYLMREAVQEQVTAAQGVAQLVRLCGQEPRLALYRFYWGALRRALTGEEGRA